MYGTLTDAQAWEKGLVKDRSINPLSAPVRAEQFATKDLFEILSTLIATNCRSAIELGCGSGSYASQILSRANSLNTVDGIDFSDRLLNQFLDVVVGFGLTGTGYKQDLLEPIRESCIGKYDWVFSGGLTEHFYGSAFDKILDAHDRLLKPGGFISISTPNFHGINYFWHYLFDKPSLMQHNLMAMRPEPYESFFGNLGYKVVFSGYVDPPMFWGVSTFQGSPTSVQKTAFAIAAEQICENLNRVLAALYDHDPNSFTGISWSPKYLYIAKKGRAS